MIDTTPSAAGTWLKVRLVGRFSIQDDAGRNCTPRSAKARGVLALLCQAPDRARSRRWLQAHLWSDRGVGQANGSLRQALLEIRRALGPAAHLLRADREEVTLIAATTDLEADPGALAAVVADDQTFLRGLDPRDRAFSGWLAAERTRLRGLATRPAKGPSVSLPVELRLGPLPVGISGLAAQAMADTVAKLLSESAEVEIFYHPHGIAPLGLVLSLDPVTAPGLAQIHAGVLAAASGQVLWSGSTALTLSEPEATGSGLAFARFAFQTAEAAQAALPGLRGRPDTVPCADILIAEAIDDLFSFVPDRLQKAETRLVLAGKLRASPRSLAWRAFLRRVMVLERVGGDTVTLAKEALVLASQAQDLGAGNALVLGLCSQVHAAFDGAADAAAILARDALVLSPCNAHAHAAQAVALLRGGRIGAARLAAVRGASVATGSLRQHWWDHIAGQTALAIGDLPAAITAFEAAYSRAPAFRSPLRNLVNLYHRTGDTARHLRALGALQRIAPDMTGADDGDENDGPGRAAPPTPHPKDQDQMSWISQIPPTPARTA